MLTGASLPVIFRADFFGLQNCPSARFVQKGLRYTDIPIEPKWHIFWKIWPIKWKVNPPKKEVKWVLRYLRWFVFNFCSLAWSSISRSRDFSFPFVAESSAALCHAAHDGVGQEGDHFGHQARDMRLRLGLWGNPQTQHTCVFLKCVWCLQKSLNYAFAQKNLAEEIPLQEDHVHGPSVFFPTDTASHTSNAVHEKEGQP